ncbi:MAG: V-type ATP synthase subunit I [Oscillospiraceae bacterium]|nr:V-type ATP synthase subunit I [Oscillospiraceae bacterium]
MAIEKMKRLRLVAVRSEKETLLRELTLLGCVQINEPEEPEQDTEEARIFSREAAGLGERKAEYEKLLNALGILNGYVSERKGMFAPKPEVTAQSVMDDTSLSKSLELAAKITDTDEHIKRLTAEESRVKGQTESLRPWETLDIPFETSGTRTCFVIPGAVPASVRLRALEEELYAAVEESQLIEVSSDREQHYLLLIAMKENKAAVLEIVRKYGFSTSSVAELKGTAAENISKMSNKLKELEAEKADCISQLEAMASVREELKLCADRLLTKTERAENTEKLLYTDSTINFEGWVPAGMEKQLVNVLANFDCAWETIEPAEEETPDVPVKLRNNAFSSPYSMLTEMYSMPAYNGIDPNPFLMLFFSMFFGIIIADLGYGAILFLGGLLYKSKAKPQGAQARAPGLLMICGVSSAIFGLLSGSFFGDSIAKIAGMYGHTVSIPALIDPLNNPLQVLIGSLVLGFIQLIVGTAINGYMLIRDGHWLDAIFDVGSLWLLFAGIALGALGVTWYVAYAAVAMIVLTQGRSSPSIAGKIGNGIFSLYNIASGWFGDILSYCRLMALMLAGAVIGSVFNTLGTMTGNIIGFALLFLIGHALNLSLSLIGAFVHSLRLQYLEFFGKFYREGGKPYQPLAIKTNYFNIIEED